MTNHQTTTDSTAPRAENSGDISSTEALKEAAPAVFPIMLGIVPFGLAYAIVGRAAGLTAGELLLMSAAVFAGASQMIAVSILSEGVTAAGVLMVATLLVNLRHVLMGATLAPHVERFSMPRQALIAFFMIDESFALTINRAERAGFSFRYYLAVGLLFFCGWFTVTGVGIAIGGLIEDPFALPIEFVMPATFMVLVVPFLRTSTGRAAAAVGAIAAVLGALYIEGHWYIEIAGVASAVTGTLLETYHERRSDAR